jgi:multiple sugar transport system permease protein
MTDASAEASHAAAAAYVRRRTLLIEQAIGYGLLAPALVAIGILLLFPLLYSVWLSLTDAALLSSAPNFVGLRNYADFITSPQFLAALWHDVVYSVGATALSVGLGLGFALLMNRRFPGRSLLSGLIIAPYLIPSVATFLIFKWQLSTQFGIVNHALLSLHLIDEPISWLGNRSVVMLTVIVVSAWAFFPFAYMAILARLQTIPPNLYDAARVDGANALQRFQYVVLPQLRNVLFVVILLRGIWVFNNFDMIWLLTGGGPNGATEHLPILVYREVFLSHSLSRGAAASIVMFLILLASSAVYFVVAGRTRRRAP